MTDVYLEEIVLFNERIINITKSMGDIMVLYPINTQNTYRVDHKKIVFLDYLPGRWHLACL